jgi:hypothetical protein
VQASQATVGLTKGFEAHNQVVGAVGEEDDDILAQEADDDFEEQFDIDT